MQADKTGTLQTQNQKQAIQTLLALEPKLHDRVQLDVLYVDNIDSTNIQPQHWDTIGQAILSNYKNYDGFVITHGTNTMSYTASALSFSLQNLGKPVVLTGAQIPGYKLETDARRNFVNAVCVALEDIAGVVVVFDEEIMLGARSSKVSESKLDAFETINAADIGEIRTDIRLSPVRKHRHNKPIKFVPGFENNILVVTLIPGMTTELLQPLLKQNIRGIILRGYGPGDVAYNLLPFIKQAYQQNLPVIMTSQCLEGATAMHMNDVGKKALATGALQTYDMSIEAVTTKLMWAVSRTKNIEKIHKIMHKNYCGEIKLTHSK